jgi:cell division transport system ATP-binding protein
MIHFQNISKLYPYNTVALENVNILIERGEFVTVIGRSGAGKTTFTKLILREEKPSSGHIFFESDDIAFLSGKKLQNTVGK